MRPRRFTVMPLLAPGLRARRAGSATSSGQVPAEDHSGSSPTSPPRHQALCTDPGGKLLVRVDHCFVRSCMRAGGNASARDHLTLWRARSGYWEARFELDCRARRAYVVRKRLTYRRDSLVWAESAYFGQSPLTAILAPPGRGAPIFWLGTVLLAVALQASAALALRQRASPFRSSER